MKFALSLVAIALLAAAEGSIVSKTLPGRGKYSKSKLFVDNLDEVQGALEDIAMAGIDLETMEGKLQTLVDNKDSIFTAEKNLEDAVDASVYKNDFKHNA